MNSRRRSRLKEAIELLSSAADIADEASQEEYDYAENMPESMQDTDRYDKAIDAAEILEEASELIGEAIDKIDKAIE